jgi:anti-sigma-K factor RskA
VSDHDRYDDLVAPYLLGAVDASEAAEFEAHLETCARCREELELLRVGADALPSGVPQYDPPPELRERVMSVVRREAELLAAAGPDADRVPARSGGGAGVPWWRRLRLAGPAAAAGVAAVAAALVLVLGGEDVRTVEAAQAPAGSEVRMLMHGEHSTLVAEDLPAPPRGRIYQVWLKRPGHDPEPTPALFRPSEAGTASVDMPGPPGGIEAVLVTDEPPGGSAEPTSDPVITISPS